MQPSDKEFAEKIGDIDETLHRGKSLRVPLFTPAPAPVSEPLRPPNMPQPPDPLDFFLSQNSEGKENSCPVNSSRGGGGIASPKSRLGDISHPRTRRTASAAVAALLAVMLSLFIAVPSFAANVNGNVANVGATAYNEQSQQTENVNIENQTIVGEGANNNVVITNTATTAPSPTGIFMANATLFIIGAFIIAGAIVVIARAKKKAGEQDE